MLYVDGLVQNCSNSIANALELLQYCLKPSMYPIQLMAYIRAALNQLLRLKTHKVVWDIASKFLHRIFNGLPGLMAHTCIVELCHHRFLVIVFGHLSWRRWWIIYKIAQDIRKHR